MKRFLIFISAIAMVSCTSSKFHFQKLQKNCQIKFRGYQKLLSSSENSSAGPASQFGWQWQQFTDPIRRSGYQKLVPRSEACRPQSRRLFHHRRVSKRQKFSNELRSAVYVCSCKSSDKNLVVAQACLLSACNTFCAIFFAVQISQQFQPD